MSPETGNYNSEIAVSPVYIHRLSNSLHYFLKTVLIINSINNKYRLIVCFRNQIDFEEEYDSIKGAKVAFKKLFNSWAFNEFSTENIIQIHPVWSGKYKPELQWLLKFLLKSRTTRMATKDFELNALDPSFSFHLEVLFKNLEKLETYIDNIESTDYLRRILQQAEKLKSAYSEFFLASSTLRERVSHLLDQLIMVSASLGDTNALMGKSNGIFKYILDVQYRLAVIIKIFSPVILKEKT